MSRTRRRHLSPRDFAPRRQRGRKTDKPVKQTRANERAALRKEHR